MDDRVDEWMTGRTDGRLTGWRVDDWECGGMDGLLTGRMDEWVTEWMSG